IQIFKEYILPEIKDDLYRYVWVDLFAGEGNLILPILEIIPENNRIEFFKKHIFLFDIQEGLVNKAIDNAVKYGVPREIAQENIYQRDTIKDYPSFLLNFELPIFHITNPPYLYIGYIVKHQETQKYIDYFQGENKGFQDLYQLALVNDLRYGIKKMVYIIPSNFLFGFSVSNKIRNVFLPFYTIKKAIIFEREIFEFTGTNVIICFFERKDIPKNEIISFKGIKINKIAQKREYILDPKNQYRAGSEFEEFVNEYKAIKPLNITYYLTIEEVEKNKGQFEIEVLNANVFNKAKYEKMKIYVNEKLFNKIKSNILFIRTLDTGTINGRAGLYKIKDVFDTDGILVTKARYRTHPIQVFIQPFLTIEEQTLLKDYFNLLLEYFREKTDSEFMTTYKYSNSEYIRKYLGLSQAKDLIQTFPLLDLNENDKVHFKNLIVSKNVKEIINYVRDKNKKGGFKIWF
ncbi:MAG: SAM-dependent DNA methyltransferase, partial [Nitrososphaerota archaeon]